MARKQRAKSATGIYHVMLRGINKQDVFLDDNDFESMIRIIKDVRYDRDAQGNILPDKNCIIYAYCILHNHLHLLIKEEKLSISEVMKKIQDRFVIIYNRKYDRVGHLFQDRFLSEPVENFDYFLTLLRYIHRNPVKAMEAKHPEDYVYSSWKEYIIKGSDPLMMHVCDIDAVLEKIDYEELVEWVNMDVDDDCMDMDSFRQPMPEQEAWERLGEISQTESVELFKQLSPDLQVKYISELISQGASLQQASRLSSLSYRALWNRLHPELYLVEQEKAKEQRRLKREMKKKA